MSHFFVLGTQYRPRLVSLVHFYPLQELFGMPHRNTSPSEVQCLQRQVLLHLEDQWPKVSHQAPDVQRGSPRVPVL